MSEINAKGSERVIKAKEAAEGGFKRVTVSARYLGYIKNIAFQGRKIAVYDETNAYHIAYLKPDGSIAIYTEESTVADNFFCVWENFSKLVEDLNDDNNRLTYPTEFIEAIGDAIGEKYVEK